MCILNRLPVFLVGKPGCSKSLAMQLIFVILQTAVKLPQLSAAALFDKSVGPGGFWIFFSALIVNSLYPCVLLRYKSAKLQRDAVAAFVVVIG